MARLNRAAEAARKKSPRASAAKASGRLADPKLEKLAQEAAAKGLHPLPVARRIISRMAAARSYEDAPHTGSWSQHGVRTGYNTDWLYVIEKMPSGGYALAFVPADREARRGGKGPHHLGGYIAPSSSARGSKLSGSAHAYRTQAEARKAAVAHMGTGGYLTYQNPAVAKKRSGPSARPAGRSVLTASHLEGMGYDAARALTDASARRSKALFVKRALEDDRFERLSPMQLAHVKKGAAHRYEVMQRYFRNQDTGPMDMPYPMYNNPARSLADMEQRIKFLRDEQHYDSDAAYAELQRLVSAYKAAGGETKRVHGPYPGTSVLLVGSEVKGYKAQSKRMRVRANPTDWALAYEGRLRDMTRESDGLIRVEENPRGRRGRVVSSSRAAGLAKGQSLMTLAARAFHAGQYPDMASALKGVSKKRR